MLFIREALRNPAGMATGVPSSREIAERIVKLAGTSRANRIIELGAGTGTITEEILRQLPTEGRLLAIERHPVFVAELQRRFPGISVVRDCASNLARIAGACGIRAVDAVVSTLPWIQFSNGQQVEMLRGIREVLAPSGIFVTTASFGGPGLNRGQAFRHHLEQAFARVGSSSVFFKNFPPLFIYECRQPRPGTRGLPLAA